jgi:hypothetical protein
MRLSCAALFTILIAFAAHGSIRVGPELALAAPVRAPLDGNQSSPVVATDGDQFLAFWTSIHGLNVAHVAADGRLLSSHLAVAAPSVLGLSATWTGSVYLATWRDSSQNALLAATFTRNGDLRSRPEVIVSGAAQTRTGASASNGHRTLMLYSYGEAGNVRAAIFDVSGNAIEVDRSISARGTATNLSDLVPVLASDGNEFAAVWRTGALVPIPAGVTQQDTPPALGVLVHDFHLIRLDEDGNAVGSQLDIGRVDQTADFGLAFGGGRYVIVATETHLIKPGQTQARLVRLTVDPQSSNVTRLPSIDTNGGPASVFWSGSTFVGFWMNYTNTSFAVVTLAFSGADEAISPTPITSIRGSNSAYSVSIRSNGRHAFAAWNQNTGTTSGEGSQIYGSLLEAEASHADTAATLISIGWSRQFLPMMASSPTGSLVIWIEDGYAGRQLLARRTDVTGAFIDSGPFEIAVGVSQATLVFTGDVYLVAWQESGSLVVAARSVGRDASLGPRMELGNGWQPAAASNGSTALVVFSSGTQHVFGYRFDAAGRPIDTAPLALGDGYAALVASNGTGFFVAWDTGSDYWQFPSPDMVDVFGKLVSATGAVDAAPLPIATGSADQRLVALASDGRDYLVVYGLGQYSPATLATKVVLREGQLDGTTATDEGGIIARDPGYGTSLSGDASGYWIAYLRGNGTASILRLDQRGTAASPATTLAAPLSSVALARLPGGAVRVLYARAIDDGEFIGTSSAFFRSIGDDVIPRSRAARH